MWKDSSKELVTNLKAAAFEQISKGVPAKISDVLDCEPITSLIKHAGEDTVQMYVEHELIKLASMVNVNQALNLKDGQVPTIAQHLIENYKWESLEDFTLCFRRASCGLYGEIYRIDGAVIGQWMSRYLDEKYDALEQRKAKFKPEKTVVRESSTAHADACIKQILENLGAPTEPENNAKENAYQREKMSYIPKGEDYVNEKKERIKEGQRLELVKKYPAATTEQIESMLEQPEFKKYR